MNVQSKLVNFVTRRIRDQMDGSSNRCIKLFIAGGAGTGKTFTLKILKEQIKRSYGSEISFKVCALTGGAARLALGSTLHSTLKLPIEKEANILKMPTLTGNVLGRMRMQWQDVKFLIVDEVSMLSYEMLCMIDQRLKQLKDSTELFGGLNMLLFGDLMQLPPVRGNAIFNQPECMKTAIHLWHQFSFCELTENIRQQGDATFVDLLNDLRVGALQKHHIQLLMTKLQGNNTGDFSVERALRIHPTIRQVDFHNKNVLKHFASKNVSMSIITAQDKRVDNTCKTKIHDLAQPIPTRALPKQLTIFIGAKVMLRYNVDTGKGLINGAMGAIVEIIWSHLNHEDIPSVRINFGDIGIHRIEPMSVQFPAKYSSGTVERRMLPLNLCWSSTVHKMQGTTVDRAVINLGSQIFAPGQAYVALSRVRSLAGLRLEELDCAKLTSDQTCNKKALREMQRLRQLPDYRQNQ